MTDGMEVTIYAEDIKGKCPWCRGRVEPDYLGSGQDAREVSATCMRCYSTFPLRSESKKIKPMDDDESIEF
jgi:hypothetical protein